MLKMEEDNAEGIPNGTDGFDLASWSYPEEGLTDGSSLPGPYENSSDIFDVPSGLCSEGDLGWFFGEGS